MYPSLYWTGRRSCDPLGTLPLTESLVVAGTGHQTGTNRVCDYAHQCLDPDGVTFWSTSEYMGGTSGASAARTRIFSYQITPCSNAAGVSIALTGCELPQAFRSGQGLPMLAGNGDVAQYAGETYRIAGGIPLGNTSPRGKPSQTTIPAT